MFTLKRKVLHKYRLVQSLDGGGPKECDLCARLSSSKTAGNFPGLWPAMHSSTQPSLWALGVHRRGAVGAVFLI